MRKNMGESLEKAYEKDLKSNNPDLYADMNEENAQKSALKEEQKKALDAYESKKDGESGNLYDDVNKKYELEAEQEKSKEAYESNFMVPKKGSAEDLENEKNEKSRQSNDLEKEKRATEFKKEEEKRQEKKDFVNSYKQQFGEEKDIINNPKKSGTVASNFDTPVSNAPIDNETENQKKIRERNENMPDKIGDELLDNDLKERAAKILATGEHDAETQRKIINKQDDRNNDLSIENEQLEKFFEIADKRLDAMKNEVEKQIEEVKNPTLKESIIGFLKKPKVKGAIVFGLAGAAVYAASGGTAVPIYFAVKAALASVGVEIFVPAAVGHGLSTWGTAAVVGGATGEFASYLSKKLGLSKGEKSNKEKHQAGLENLKNIANGQQVNETRQEGQSQVENNPAQKSEPEEQKPKKKSFWKEIFKGGDKKEENIEQQPETAVEPKKSTGKEEERTNSEVISSEVNEMENLIINFKKGETSGKELLEYVQILEELRKKYGDEEAKPLIGAIQSKTYSFDEKTRGQIVDAMIEYAQKEKMKPSEVLDYVAYFENINHIGKAETYRWLMGKEKEGIEFTAQFNNIDDTTGKKNSMLDFKAGITLNGDKGEKSASSPEVTAEEKKEEEKLENDKILKTEVEKIKNFIQDLKKEKKTGKESFDLARYIVRLERKYDEGVLKEISSSINKEINLEEQVFILDSLTTYLRENNLTEGKKIIERNLNNDLMNNFNLYIARNMKKENIEWLELKPKN